ncbi:MAG: hypothetical protein AAGF11_29315 [Myxococcota bacterium]
MRGFIVVTMMATMASLGCTGQNPDFQDTDRPTSGDTTQSTGIEETTSGTPADGESNPDTATNPEESGSQTAGSSSEGPADCALEEQHLVPIRDNFLVASGMCGDGVEEFPCAAASFGSTSRGFIRGPEQSRTTYLLLTFNMGGFSEIGDGELQLRVFDPQVPFTLEITPVFPGTWIEGYGDSGEAQADASSWNWSMRPTPWVPDKGDNGTFQAVLDDAPPPFEESFDPPKDASTDIIDVPVSIASEILADLDEFGRLNLAVTVVGELDELEVNAANSVSNTPRLFFNGC